MYISDSSYTFVHFTNPNQVLYVEKWTGDEPILFDDIDTRGLFEATSNLFPQFMLDEEEEGGIPINPTNFSAKYYKSKRLSKEKIWSDSSVYENFFRGDKDDGDRTILKPLTNKQIKSVDDDLSLGQFMSNGYNHNDNFEHMMLTNDFNDSIMGNNSDLSINLHSDFIPPNFPKRNGSTSNSFNPAQTPKIGRARQPSNDRTYQTPISRRNFTE